MVNNRAVRILLECFLVSWSLLSVNIASWLIQTEPRPVIGQGRMACMVLY